MAPHAASLGEPLALEHQSVVDEALHTLATGQAEKALSDLTFANLYLFRQVHDYRYLPGPLPCISGRSYDGARHLIPLFELQAVPVKALRGRMDGHDVFFPLATEQVQGLNPQFFEWAAVRDDADYLYPAEHFRHYRGRALNKKRNLVKQLVSGHSFSAQVYGASHIESAKHVLAQWMSAKVKAPGEADELACLEALHLADTLGLRGFLHHVDGEAAGFILAEPLQAGVWVIRFAKGMDHIKGIYQAMFQHVCQTRPEVQWLNFEQDLGIANLRKTKQSYQPAFLLSKFRVRLRAP